MTLELPKAFSAKTLEWLLDWSLEETTWSMLSRVEGKPDREKEEQETSDTPGIGDMCWSLPRAYLDLPSELNRICPIHPGQPVMSEHLKRKHGMDAL